MSLLNDALKRASQSHFAHETVRIHIPVPAAPANPAMPAAPAMSAVPAAPAAMAPVESHPKSGLGWLPILVVLTVAVAGAFILLGHFSAKHRVHAAAIVPVSRPIPPAPKPAPPPAKAVAVTAPAPPTPPPLRLQGISFYDAHWEAIINGRTVYVGNTIHGFRVAVISGNKVLLVAPDGSWWKLVLSK
jgi:hypothetical protein